MTPSVAIIGAGKVGSALARTWAAHGIRIPVIASRTLAHAEALASEVGASATTWEYEAAEQADLTVLSVPDDIIDSTIIRTASIRWAGKAVIHTSGAHNLDTLAFLKARGAMIGSMHPAYPFAHRNVQPDALRGVTFALESSHPELAEWLYDLVSAAEGHALPLRPDQKRLYHAALTLTSNYAVTLYAASRRLLQSIGAEDETADAALLALFSGTLDNLREHGIPDALTGPLVRGDIGTIEAHLEGLSGQQDLVSAYLALARLTLPLLEARRINTGSIEGLLKKWEGS